MHIIRQSTRPVTIRPQFEPTATKPRILCGSESDAVSMLRTFPSGAPSRKVDYVLTVGEQGIPVEVKYAAECSPSSKKSDNAPLGVLVGATSPADRMLVGPRCARFGSV